MREQLDAADPCRVGRLARHRRRNRWLLRLHWLIRLFPRARRPVDVGSNQVQDVVCLGIVRRELLAEPDQAFPCGGRESNFVRGQRPVESLLPRGNEPRGFVAVVQHVSRAFQHRQPVHEPAAGDLRHRPGQVPHGGLVRHRGRPPGAALGAHVFVEARQDAQAAESGRDREQHRVRAAAQASGSSRLIEHGVGVAHVPSITHEMRLPSAYSTAMPVHAPAALAVTSGMDSGSVSISRS